MQLEIFRKFNPIENGVFEQDISLYVLEGLTPLEGLQPFN